MAVSQTQLEQLYLAYFGRPADFDGLVFYTSNPNFDIWTVAAAFSASPESQALYGTGFSAATINAIYQNLFNRDAEPAGLLYWSQEVASGRLSAAGAAYGILLGAQNEDLVTVNNKMAASAAFTAALNTAPEIIGYSGDDAAQAARDWLAGVTADPATLTAALAGVDAAVAAVVGVGGVDGETFTLTTGVDNVVGTANDDTILGSNDVNGTGDITFNIGDNIDGGAGVDTLVVASDANELTFNARTVTNVENLTVLNGYDDFSVLNLANKAFETVTVDYASTNMYDYLYIDGIKADTDLVVQNVQTDGYYVYRNYDGVYSTLEGAVTQNNTFNDIDYSVNDSYLEFDNYAYFAVATQLNLTNTLDNLITGGTTSTGSDEWFGFYDYIELQADNATINVTYNFTNVLQPDSYSGIYADIYNGADADTADVVNAVVNVDNVDGLEVYIDNDNTGTDSESDVFTLNVAGGGYLNTYGGNVLSLDDFETLNFNIQGDTELEYVDAYDNVSDAQTINIVADADFAITGGVFDEADDQEVTVNMSGSGDVTIDFNGDNYGLTVNAGTATGKLNLEVGSDATYATVVTTGSGDDTVTLLNAFELNTEADAFLQVLNGGAGTDTFEMDATALLTSIGLLNTDVTDFSDAVMNFERLSLTGVSTQDIDATKLGFNHVTIDGYTTGGSLTIGNGGTLIVKGAGTTDYTVVVEDADTGEDDSLTVGAASQGTTDATNSGITLAGLAVADVETISIQSTSKDDATEVEDETENDINVVGLVAAETVTLNISGDTALTLSGTLTALETVAAAGFHAGLNLDASSSGEAVTVTVGDGDNSITGTAQADKITTGAGYDTIIGGVGNDVIDTGNGGSEITGGAGKDTITLGSGVTEDDVDVIIYAAVTDSQGVTVDVINGFQADIQSTDDLNSDDVVDEDDVLNDVLDFSAMLLVATATYLGEANGYGAVLTSLTGDIGDAVLDSSTSTLYIDVDGSGTLDNADMAIQLTGVTDLSADNFIF